MDKFVENKNRLHEITLSKAIKVLLPQYATVFFHYFVTRAILTKMDHTLLQLAIAYEKGHQELFNAAKDHLGGLSLIDWQNIIAQNAKIISKCIRLAKKHEPSLLNAITSHVQRLSQESLEATLNEIQAHIPILARYAIKSQRAELCQVLSQALELDSVDR